MAPELLEQKQGEHEPKTPHVPAWPGPPNHRTWPRSCPLLNPLYHWSGAVPWWLCCFEGGFVACTKTASITHCWRTPCLVHLALRPPLFLQKSHRTLEETQGLHQEMGQKISLDQGKAQQPLSQSSGRESTQHWKPQESCKNTELCYTLNILGFSSML